MRFEALRNEDADTVARRWTGGGGRRWPTPTVVVLALLLAACGSTGESLAAGEIEAQLAAAVDPTTTVVSEPTTSATIVLPLPTPASAQPTADSASADAVAPPAPSSTTPTTAAATTARSTAAPSASTAPTTAPTTSPTSAPSPTSETTSPPTTQVAAPSSTAETAPEIADPEIVEFRIAPGTGSGPWNTFENPVRIRVGQILRVHNDDAVAHTIHANGAPFPHGNRIAPGSFRDHLVVRPSEPSAGSPRLYEHTAGRSAAFWVFATS